MPHKGHHDDDYHAMEMMGGHSHGHSHGHEDEKEKERRNYEASKKKLYLVSVVTMFFIVAQSIGGYLSGSIAIITDTAHLATDMVGFAISIFCLRLSQKDASQELTYGWHRAEIIGTLVSIIFLVTVTMILLKEAIYRVLEPPELESNVMLITAVCGLFFNLIQMKILHQGEGHYHLGGDDHDHDHGEEGHDHDHDHGHDHNDEGNINVSAAYCHAVSDMIMSIGVIIASIIIYYKPTWQIADPICTFFFSVIVCLTVVPITKKCIHVLMEGAPDKIDLAKLVTEIKQCDPEMEMHDIHVWSITQSKVAMSCHIITKKNTQQVLREVNQVCQKFKIGHSTIQIEDGNKSDHQFDCHQSTHKQLDLLNKSPSGGMEAMM